MTGKELIPWEARQSCSRCGKSLKLQHARRQGERLEFALLWCQRCGGIVRGKNIKCSDDPYDDVTAVATEVEYPLMEENRLTRETAAEIIEKLRAMMMILTANDWRTQTRVTWMQLEAAVDELVDVLHELRKNTIGGQI